MNETINGAIEVRHPFARLLVNKNPFYVISAACVIHGSSYWFRSNADAEPWSLMALVGGFIFLLTIIGFCVVKFGRLWDDARSIFVMLFLLFVELALSFDDAFVTDWKDGCLLLICGWLFVVLVFEFLFHSLRIRFRALFRVPFHTMLALLFLYPLSMVWAIQLSHQRMIQWQLLGFNVAVAVSVFLLLPAIRRGKRYADSNGTPWIWPLFPWLPIGILIVALTVRGFAMCASLDPAILQSVTLARELQSVFDYYFLCPIILAVAFVLFEFGRVECSGRLTSFALTIPVLVVFLAVPTTRPSSLQYAFLQDLSTTICTPLFFSLCASACFYLLAAIRSVRAAEWYLSAAVLGFVYVSPDTASWSSHAAPQIWPLVVVSVAHTILGLLRRGLLQSVFGITLVVASCHNFGVAQIGRPFMVAAEVHAALAVMLFVGLYRTNRLVLSLVAVILTSVVAGVLFSTHGDVAQISPAMRFGYATAMLAATVTLFFVTRLWVYASAATVLLSCLAAATARNVWLQIRHIHGWQGLVFYAAGVVWLLIAIAVSVWKARRKESLNSGIG